MKNIFVRGRAGSTREGKQIRNCHLSGRAPLPCGIITEQTNRKSQGSSRNAGVGGSHSINRSEEFGTDILDTFSSENGLFLIKHTEYIDNGDNEFLAPSTSISADIKEPLIGNPCFLSKTKESHSQNPKGPKSQNTVF